MQHWPLISLSMTCSASSALHLAFLRETMDGWLCAPQQQLMLRAGGVLARNSMPLCSKGGRGYKQWGLL